LQRLKESISSRKSVEFKKKRKKEFVPFKRNELREIR
jgi:hypothetical protein